MKKTKMLKKNYEFKNVLSRGKYYSGKCIEAFIKDNHKNCNFLGLAISVKTGKAVRRNQIKRLIRENYKNYEDKIGVGNNIIIIVNKNKSSENIEYYGVKKDFENILSKAGVLK